MDAKRLVVSLGTAACLFGMTAPGFSAAVTPTPGGFTAMECARTPRTPGVAAWIQTPGAAGAPVIAATPKPSAGAWQPPVVSLTDLPTGPAVNAAVTKALDQTLAEISQCALFPGDAVDAYFSDDFFRRVAVAATPGPGFSWGFAGLSGVGEAATVEKAWDLPDDKVAAIVNSPASDAPLVIIFAKAPTTGDWQVDEMAYLATSNATPTP
jgi:hypothetical protein